MPDIARILTAGLILAGSAQPSTARAAARIAEAESLGVTRVLHRVQVPPKSEACKARWPSNVLICVA